MLKKITTLLICFIMVFALCVPVAFADVVSVSSKGETKIATGASSGANNQSNVKANYMSCPSGSWIQYTVDVPKDGKYKIDVYGCGLSNKSIKLGVAINAIEKAVGTIIGTKSANDYQTVVNEMGIFDLKKGINTITLTNKGGDAHLGALCITPSVDDLPAAQIEKQSGAYKEAYLPTIIYAENFDIGTAGSKSADGKNAGGAYRKNAGIDIAEESGSYVVTLNKEEFLKYTFNVVKDDVYNVGIKASGSADLEIYFDDSAYPVNTKFSSANLGTMSVCDIFLKEGQHNIKIAGATSAIKLDEIIFTVSDSEKYIGVESLIVPQKTAEEGKTEEAFDYDTLDKANEVYKEIYVSANGNDEGDGTKGSPFKTFDRVLAELEKITPQMTGDVIVNVLSGYYPIEETIKMTEIHGGKNGFNVILKGENPDSKPILSGGLEVTGWEKATDYIWKAPAPQGISVVRNLYVGDYPAIRARTKYKYSIKEFYVAEGSKYRRDGLYVDSANFPKVERPETMEMVCENMWASNRYLVEDILYGNNGENIVLMQNPMWSRFDGLNSHTPRVDSLFYFENAKEFLDEPGEFFYDDSDGYIYYYPYKAEDMTTVETYVGKTEYLLDVRGSSKNNKISNVILDNLCFKYGAWDFVEQGGIQTYQADVMASPTGGDIHTPEGSMRCAPGQVQINRAQNITVKNCEFSCLGSSALDLEDAVQNVKIEGNVIRDISGGAIMIGTANHAKASGSMAKIDGETCKNFLVTNNVIRRIGGEYANQTAISVYYEANIDIIHNDIGAVPYTGITAGWGWETASLRSDEHKNIVITHNKISDVMRVLEDGAHVYTLGDLPGSVIAYNYFERSHHTVYAGVYLDQGTAYTETHHNVFIDNVRWFFVQSGYYAEDNKAYQNYSDNLYWQGTGTQGAGKNSVEEAIEINPYNILPEAQEIIDDAGLEGKYKYLLDNAELPSWKDDRSTKRATDRFDVIGDTATYGWLEAENYMPGKNGETYFKKSDVWENNMYRKEGVQLVGVGKEFTGVGTKFVIEQCESGEWTKYKLLAPVDGEYQFKIRYGHGNASDLHFNIYIDDELVINNMPVEKSSWTKIVEKDGPLLNLTAGEHIVKFEYVEGGFYMDALGFIRPDIPITEQVKTTSPDYDECVFELEQEKIPEPEFLDIDGHWAQRDIVDMKDKGIINGISPIEFGPDKPITREQAVWICMRAKNIPHNMENWEDKALELGMISEKGNGSEIISREEFAHIVMKTYTYTNPTYKVTIGEDYKDKAEIAKTYYYEIMGLKKLGLMAGDENNCFRPKDNLTRAEALVVAKRLMG